MVICTYNHAALLDQALSALARQTLTGDVDWQILVVNNNCTDATDAVVKSHAVVAPVPLTMVDENDQGLTPARLRGVVSTAAAWIAFVDDDCLLAEDWIAEAARFASAHPDCGAFAGAVVLDWEVPPPAFVPRFGWAFAEQDHGPAPRTLPCLAGAGLVARRAALAECGWIDRQFLADRIGNKLVSGGDVEIALRIGSRHDLWYNPACRLRHRIPEHRASPTYVKAVVHGLGTSQLMGDSLLWAGTYRRWLATSLLRSGRFLRTALRDAARAALGRGEAIDAAVSLCFVRGWFIGIWRMARMDGSERHALLGCAVPRRAHPTPAERRSDPSCRPTDSSE